METKWIEDVCLIPLRFNDGTVSIRELFEAAQVTRADRPVFEGAVRAFLETRPELVEAWATYSANKRSSPSPYFEVKSAESVVGFFEQGRESERWFADSVAACAAFIFDEAVWVIEGRRP